MDGTTGKVQDMTGVLWGTRSSLGRRKQGVGREEIQMMPIVQDNKPLMPKDLRKKLFPNTFSLVLGFLF